MTTRRRGIGPQFRWEADAFSVRSPTMGGIVSRGLVGLGVLGLVVVGCTDAGTEVTGATQQAVFAANAELHTGADLPEKTLVLTFDDGPAGENSGAQTRAISTYLKGKGIKAVFFAVGSCIASTRLPGNNGCTTPSDGVDTTIRQLFADGHLLANHTTTHRSMTGLSTAAAVTDVLETDTDLQAYEALIPWNRWFFRAPQGNWSSAYSTAADANGSLKKYVGPIYWNAGGDTTAGREADWNCWPSGRTTRQCGDSYLAEIRRQKKGIVLMHDQNQYPSPNLTITAPPAAPNYDVKGNTYLLVRYVVEALEAEGGWKYTTLDEVPSIKSVLPTCDATCGTCDGPAATDCRTCGEGRYLDARACKACTACPTGTFASTTCTASADAACTSCTSCPAGKVVFTACTATTDTVCSDEPPPVPPPPPTAPSSSGGAPSVDGGRAGDAAPSDSSTGCASAPPRASSPFGALVVGLGLLGLRRRRRAA